MRTPDGGSHLAPRPLESRVEIPVGDVRELRPRRDPGVPECLGEPHVPDSRYEALGDPRLADEKRLIGVAQPQHDVIEIRFGSEQIRPEAIDAPSSETQDRTVPLRRLPLPAAENEPRRASPHRVSDRPDAPASAHPQMAVNHDASVEVQEHVLPDGLDALEHATVDRTCDTGRETAGIRALGFEPLAHEHLQAPSRTVERVTFGHGSG